MGGGGGDRERGRRGERERERKKERLRLIKAGVQDGWSWSVRTEKGDRREWEEEAVPGRPAFRIPRPPALLAINSGLTRIPN